MKSYQIVWMGSTEFSSGPLLQVIEDGHRVLAICSHIYPSPTVRVAQELGIPVHVVSDPGDSEFALKLLGYQADFFIVCDFLVLPEEIINIPKLGCIGIRPSLLPRFRGIAPIEAFLQSKLDSTGVTTFLLSKDIDSGDILKQQIWEFDRFNDMYPKVRDALEFGARELISETLQNFDSSLPISQDDLKWSPRESAPRITKESRRVNFKYQNPRDILNKMRAFTDNGGIWTTLEGTSTEVIIHEGFFDIIDTMKLCGCRVGQLYFDQSHKSYFIPLSRNEPVVLRPVKIQTKGQKIMHIRDWRASISLGMVRLD